MANPDLAQEAAGLLHRGAASVPETLDELVRLAASGVAGCSGASAMLCRNGESAVFAASHPDLAELATIEQASGSGPVTAAVACGAPVWSPDTLGEERWPGYAAAALVRGVRCCVTLVHHSGPVTVTLSLFGARPGQPCPQDQPLRRLAAVFGGAAPGRPAGLELPPSGSTGS